MSRYEIRRAYEDHPRRHTPRSSFEHIDYMEQIDKNGQPYLVEVGRTNLNDLVQSCFSESQIYNILDRYTRGDLDVLSAGGNSAYGDLYGMPRDVLEAADFAARVDRRWNDLPTDVRSKFKDRADFLSALSDGSFVDRFKPAEAAPAASPEEGDNA